MLICLIVAGCFVTRCAGSFQGRQSLVGEGVGEGSWFVYWNRDFDLAMKVGSKSRAVRAAKSASCKNPSVNYSLVLSKLCPIKRNTLLGDVDRQDSIATQWRRPINDETDNYGVIGLRLQIYVVIGHLRRAIIVERQQIYLVGIHCSWPSHGEKGRKSRQPWELPRDEISL